MSTTRYGQRKAPRVFFLGLGLAAVLVALTIGLRGQYSVWLAKHWQNRLDDVSDDQVVMLMGAVARLGEPGIPVLVEASGSERESVARAGKRFLKAEIRRWESLSPAEASRRLAVLADSLALHVQQFGPTARGDAAELATQILRWPLDRSAVDAGRVVASCEQVLQTTAPERDLLAQRRRSSGVTHLALGGDHVHRSPQATTRIADPRSPQDNPPDANKLAADLAENQSKGQPSAIIRLPNSVDRSGQPRLVEIAIDESPGPSSPPGSQLQPPQRLIPAPAEPPYAEARSFPNRQAALPKPALPEGPTETLDRWHPPDRFSASVPLENALEEVQTAQLMSRLHDSDPRMVVRAENELTRRGFSVLHLELARQLFDPDPLVRKQLARDLPGMAGVNAVPWLIQLSRDRDPEVRLAAVTLMATTGEPSLLDEIERISAQDPSQRVRRQAQRVAEYRRGRTY